MKLFAAFLALPIVRQDEIRLRRGGIYTNERQDNSFTVHVIVKGVLKA